MRYMHQIIAHMHRDRKPGNPDTKVWFMAPEFAGNARTAYKVAFAKMDEIGYMRVRGRNSAPTGIEGIFLAGGVETEIRKSAAEQLTQLLHSPELRDYLGLDAVVACCVAELREALDTDLFAGGSQLTMHFNFQRLPT